MTIANPSMSTKAVIMRTVSFPFIGLFPRHERGGDVSHSGERFRRDLVHCVLGRVVRRICEINHVDHMKSRLKQGHVIVGDFSAALLNEDVSVTEIGRRLPDA